MNRLPLSAATALFEHLTGPSPVTQEDQQAGRIRRYCRCRGTSDTDQVRQWFDRHCLTGIEAGRTLWLHHNRGCERAEGLATMDLDAFNAFEAAGWEARAAAYDHYWPALTGQLSDPLLDAVGAGPDTRLLDVACGPGHLAGRAAERGATAVGVDIAEPMVELARQHWPRAEFRQGDAQALPFPDRCFDAVVSSLGLPHFGRPEQAVAEFKRVLASGGRLALSSWNDPAHARLVGVLLEAVNEVGVAPPASLPPGPNFFRFADNKEFEALLVDQGFVDVGIQLVEFSYGVDSSDELWNGLLEGTVRTSAVIRGQPNEVVHRIRASFDRRVDGFRTGETFQLRASFKLAQARRG